MPSLDGEGEQVMIGDLVHDASSPGGAVSFDRNAVGSICFERIGPLRRPPIIDLQYFKPSLPVILLADGQRSMLSSWSTKYLPFSMVKVSSSADFSISGPMPAALMSATMSSVMLS